MKTSPELLSNILQVLSKIGDKLDKITEGGSKGSEIGKLFKGSVKQRTEKPEKDTAIKDLSLGVEKLNKELNKLDTKKLDSIYTLLRKSQKITQINTLFGNLIDKDLVAFKTNISEVSQGISKLNRDIHKIDLKELESIQKYFNKKIDKDSVFGKLSSSNVKELNTSLKKSTQTISQFNAELNDLNISVFTDLLNKGVDLSALLDELSAKKIEDFKKSIILLGNSTEKLDKQLHILNTVTLDQLFEKTTNINSLLKSLLLNNFTAFNDDVVNSVEKIQKLSFELSSIDVKIFEDVFGKLTALNLAFTQPGIQNLDTFKNNLLQSAYNVSRLNEELAKIDTTSIQKLMKLDVEDSFLAQDFQNKLNAFKDNLTASSNNINTLNAQISKLDSRTLYDLISTGSSLSALFTELSDVKLTKLTSSLSESAQQIISLNSEFQNLNTKSLEGIEEQGKNLNLIFDDFVNNKLTSLVSVLSQSSGDITKFNIELSKVNSKPIEELLFSANNLNVILGDLSSKNIDAFKLDIAEAASRIESLNKQIALISSNNIQELSDQGKLLKVAFDSLPSQQLEQFKLDIAESTEHILKLNQQLNSLTYKPVEDLMLKGSNLSNILDALVSKNFDGFKNNILESTSNILKLNQQLDSISVKSLDDLLIKAQDVNTKINNLAIPDFSSFKDICDSVDCIDQLSQKLSVINYSSLTDIISQGSNITTLFENLSKNVIPILQTNVSESAKHIHLLYASIHDNLQKLTESVNYQINPNSLFGDLTNSKIETFKTSIQNSSIAITKLNEELAKISLMPVDELINKSASVNEILDKINFEKFNEFKSSVVNVSDSVKKLNIELENIKPVNLSVEGIDFKQIQLFKASITEISDSVKKLNTQLESIKPINISVEGFDIQKIESFKISIAEVSDSVKKLQQELSNIEHIDLPLSGIDVEKVKLFKSSITEVSDSVIILNSHLESIKPVDVEVNIEGLDIAKIESFKASISEISDSVRILNTRLESIKSVDLDIRIDGIDTKPIESLQTSITNASDSVRILNTYLESIKPVNLSVNVEEIDTKPIESVKTSITSVSNSVDILNTQLQSIKPVDLSINVNEIDTKPIDSVKTSITSVSNSVDILNTKLANIKFDQLTIDFDEISKKYEKSIKDSIATTSDSVKLINAELSNIKPVELKVEDFDTTKIELFKTNITDILDSVKLLNTQISNIKSIDVKIENIDTKQLEEFKNSIAYISDSVVSINEKLKELDTKSFVELYNIVNAPLSKESLFSEFTVKNIQLIKQEFTNLGTSADELTEKLQKIQLKELTDSTVKINKFNKAFKKTEDQAKETTEAIKDADNKIEDLGEKTGKLKFPKMGDFFTFLKMKFTSPFMNSKKLLELNNGISLMVLNLENLLKALKDVDKIRVTSLSQLNKLLEAGNKAVGKDSIFTSNGSKKFKESLANIVEAIKDVNKELKGVDVKKINETIKALSEFDKVSAESKKQQKSAKTSAWTENAKNMGLALAYIGLGVLAMTISVAAAGAILGVEPLMVPAYVLAISAAVAFSMVILSMGSGTGDAMGRLLHTGSGGKGGEGEGTTAKAMENAKQFGIALMFIAGGILSFGVAMAAAKPLLNTDTVIGVIEKILLITAGVGLSILIISGLDVLGKKIGGDKTDAKGAIENAKQFGIALMFIAGGILSFGVAMTGAKALLGVDTALGVAGQILLIVSMIGLSMVILSTLDAVGGMAGKKINGKADSKGAIDNAKQMGIALMFIAGGILAFSISMALVPKILKTTNIGTSLLIIGGIIVVTAGLFALMGLAGPLIKQGAIAAGFMTLGLLAMGLGILVFAKIAKSLSGIGDESEKYNKYGKERSKFGMMMATIGPGLGLMGIVIVSSALLFAGIGVLGPVIGIGVAVVLGISLALMSVAKSIKKINDTINELGPGGLTTTKENIRTMIDSVLGGIVAGIYGGMASMPGDPNKLSTRDIQQFTRVKKILKLFAGMSSSISKFAKGLKAFSELGVIYDLEYKEDGTAVIGEKVNVASAAKSLAATLGGFITTFTNEIGSINKREAKNIKAVSKSLVGRKGMLSAVIKFADVLTTYSKYGENGEIPIANEDGEPSGKSVKIGIVVDNIVNSFMEFVKQLAKRAGKFEKIGEVSGDMKRFSRALMGKSGLMGAITQFTELLQTYSQYGAKGEYVVTDKEGKPTGETIRVEKIVDNIINSFVKFADSLAGKKGVFQKGGNVGKKMMNFSKSLVGPDGILEGINQFSKTVELYAKYGEKGLIDGIPITKIVANITSAFSKFVNELIGKRSVFEKTGSIGRKMRLFTEVLTGKEGLVAGIATFAATLETYAKYGKNGEIFIADASGKKDKDGNPIGQHIKLTTIVTNITTAFTNFVNGMVGKKSAFSPTGAVGKKMLEFSTVLLGKTGLIAGINDFAQVIRTFAELGKSGMLSLIEYDSKGNPVPTDKSKAKPIPITSIVKNIVDVFAKFAIEMGANESQFKEGGRAGREMRKLTLALMGEKKSRGRETPGILSGIMQFADTIQKFAEYGENGDIPKLDKDGNVIPGQTIPVETVASGIANSITKFVSALDTALTGKDISKSESIEKKLQSFSKVIETLDKLSSSSEGIDKLANSMGLLATNVELFVKQMGGFDVSKFEKMSAATAKFAVDTKDITVPSQKSQGADYSNTRQKEEEWARMAEIIGNAVAAKLNLNGTMNFYFHDTNVGVIEYAPTKP